MRGYGGETDGSKANGGEELAQFERLSSICILYNAPVWVALVWIVFDELVLELIPEEMIWAVSMCVLDVDEWVDDCLWHVGLCILSSELVSNMHAFWCQHGFLIRRHTWPQARMHAHIDALV